MSHLPIIERHEVAAARNRRRATELADSITRLLGAYRRLGQVPLDVIDRMERAIVTTHTDHLLRLNDNGRLAIAQRPANATASLHDGSCTGPDPESGCVCVPIYVTERS